MIPLMVNRLLFLLLLTWIALSGNWASAWAQSKINYKVIPNLQPMKDNEPTPEFTLATPEGKKISLKDFRGKTVFLNFWARDRKSVGRERVESAVVEERCNT